MGEHNSPLTSNVCEISSSCSWKLFSPISRASISFLTFPTSSSNEGFESSGADLDSDDDDVAGISATSEDVVERAEEGVGSDDLFSDDEGCFSSAGSKGSSKTGGGMYQ